MNRRTRSLLACVVLVTACADRSLDLASAAPDLAAVLDLSVPHDFAIPQDFAVRHDFAVAHDLRPANPPPDLAEPLDCGACSGSCEGVHGGQPACIGDGVCGQEEDCSNSVDCPCNGSCEATGAGVYYVCIGDGVCGQWLEDCSNSIDCACSASCVMAADNDPRTYICAGDGVCDHEDCHYSPTDCPCPAGTSCKYFGSGYFDEWGCF